MINLQHNPQSLAQTYLGPEAPIGLNRKCLPYSCGLASSYIPNYLFKANQPLHTASERLATNPLVTVKLLTALDNDLKNHLEGKIHLFLQQLLLVYKTKLCFNFYPSAEIQVGQVPSINGKESTYVGAHNGTLPTLRIKPLNESDSSVSFAQCTSFYYEWNATTYLPEVANIVDSAIDKSAFAKNISLRNTATDILNKVSSGELCPQDGLHNFLEALKEVITSIKHGEPSEEKKVILENYTKIVDIYCDNIANGYPLIQKLCLRPMEQVVDESFYMNVQAEMHKQLKSELQKLKPRDVAIVQLPADMDLRVLQVKIANKLPNINTATPQEYIKLCIQANAVRAAVLQYFVSLHPLSPAKISQNLDSFLAITSSATIQRVGLSNPALSLYNVALKVIRSRTKEPKNMSFILLSVMIAMIRDQIANQPAPLQAPHQIEIEKKQLRKQIQKKIEKANVKSTDTVEKYIKLCAAADNVRHATAQFFDELLHLPDSLKEKELSKIPLIKKSKIGCIGLSPKALTFYYEVLKKIQDTQKIKNPRNISLVLFRLLLNPTF